MNKKSTFALTGILIAVGIAALGLWSFGSLGSENSSDAKSAIVKELRRTAVVTTVDFVKETEIDGTLGFGHVERLPNLSTGIITWLPQPGSVIDFGDVIYKIEDVPVILLSGTVPMFRNIDATTPAALDVVQLQTHFLEMGFTDSYPVTRSMHDLNEDRYVTDVKDAEIKDWQESVGVEPTGRVNKGQIVFRPEPIRVDAVTAQLGQVANGGSLIDVSGVSRVVTAQLGTDLNGLITVNDIVQVELPDGKLVEGKTTYVADTVTRLVQGQQETTYLEVVIELVGSGTSFDQSPVTVKVEEILERGANAVPISSLLALAEGGYAVEVFESNGTVKLLGVELGTFHGNQVSISRGLKPGQSVIVP